MESNTSPTINSIKANVTTPTNQNVVVTVSAEDRVSKIKDYSWDGKKTWQTGKTKTISKNGTYTVYVRNNKNKIPSKSITISSIDNTAPMILGIEEGMIYYESVAPIIIEKNIDLIELKKDENKIVEYKNGNRINENGKYTLKVKDKANNTIVINFTINLLSLERIIIAKNPNKIEYIEGQNFDKTGMIVKAVYSNETSKKVENYEILGGENLEKGTINVKNSYTQNGVTKTIDQEITVKARETEKLIIKIKDYEEKVEENTKYIKGIKPQTTLESFKNNIETNGRIKVKKEETEITDNKVKIGTGMKIEITLNDEKVEYMLVVIGDCNGSGTTNVADLTKLMMSRAESLADNKDESKILKGAYAEAADLNNDGKISVADITKLCMYIAENKQQNFIEQSGRRTPFVLADLSFRT